MPAKDQLLHDVAEAFEQLIETASDVTRRGVLHDSYGWEPRQSLAHMAGWELIAVVRVPAVAAGLPPMEFPSDEQDAVMTNAMNAAFVTLIGDQSLTAVIGILRRAYRQDIAMLETLDDRFFQPGQYVYERTLGVIDHCHEHRAQLEAGTDT